MRIACAKCRTIIPSAELRRDEANQTLTITVHCHGEKDSMVLTDEWMINNQDFVFMIENNLTIGVAFKDAPAEQQQE